MNDRLLRLADDCEERARRCVSPEARSLYHGAAADARRCAALRHLDEPGTRLAVASVTAQATWAAYLNGDPVDAAPPPLPAVPVAPAPAVEAPRVPMEARNARQLAKHVGMSERGARKVIERGVRRGLPDFYRDGRRLYAEPQAFAQFRMSSE